MNTKREVGRRLKLARKRMGLSLQEVCDAVPTLAGNPSKLGNYESGRRAPDLDMLKAIAKVLHTDPAWLATMTYDEPDNRTQMLVHYFQASDERGKDSILRTAKARANQCKKNSTDSTPSTEEMADLMAQMGQAIGELAALLGAKSNLNEEEETRLIPIMSKIFRIIHKMGCIHFREAGRHVLEKILELAGSVVVNKPSIDGSSITLPRQRDRRER